MSDETKSCPFCAEEILSVAIKCKHCMSDLSAEERRSIDEVVDPAQPAVGKGIKYFAISFFLLFFLVFVLSEIDSSKNEAIVDEAQRETAERNADEVRNNARQGDAEAKLNAGIQFLNGNGVVNDGVEALSWFRLAADEGSADAENWIGRLYELGAAGLAVNEEEAVAWYRKAANRGLATAQFNLGSMYVDGSGVAQDYVRASNWYQRAADQGYQLAQDWLAEYDDLYGLASSHSDLVANHNLEDAELDEFIETYGSFRAVYDLAQEATENGFLFKEYLEQLSYEEDCKNDWRVCKNNSDLLNTSDIRGINLRNICKRAANQKAEELRLEIDWGGFFATNFGRYNNGTSARENGTITFEDREAKADNAFGGQTPITTTCVINVDTEQVVIVDIGL